MTDTTMIFNGGDPLKDCPRDFEAADAYDNRLIYQFAARLDKLAKPQ